MVSFEAFASELVSIATGWLGWDFDRAMKSDCLAIRIAYEGRCDMLKAIFGSSDEPAADPRISERPAREVFDAIWG